MIPVSELLAECLVYIEFPLLAPRAVSTFIRTFINFSLSLDFIIVVHLAFIIRFGRLKISTVSAACARIFEARFVHFGQHRCNIAICAGSTRGDFLAMLL
jgi:hypothetical protein